MDENNHNNPNEIPNGPEGERPAGENEAPASPPPPPADDAYQAEGYGADEFNDPFGEDDVLQAEGTAVGGAQNRRFMIIVIVMAVLMLGYVLFFSGGDDDENAPPPEQAVDVPDANDALNIATAGQDLTPLPSPTIPAIPENPTIEEPSPLPPPPPPVPEAEAPLPPPPPIEAVPEVEFVGDPEAEAQKLDQRRRSGMLVMNNSGGSVLDAVTGSSASSRSAGSSSDPNLAFAEGVASEAEQVVARNVGNLNNMVVQGKVIEAVLETAINSDLPGNLRAIVSRDIYSETGKNVLIPRGSRLIGEYNTGILSGQRRVYIVWTRVIRPDGIDVMINSPGIDQIGRAGVQGDVDNKYLEIYSNAILASTITIGTAAVGDAVSGDDVTQTQNAIGGTQTTGSASAIATQQAVQDIGSVTRSMTNRIVDLRPTITVDQGTRINVFVNKDLIFPGNLSGGSRTQIIQ